MTQTCLSAKPVQAGRFELHDGYEPIDWYVTHGFSLDHMLVQSYLLLPEVYPVGSFMIRPWLEPKYLGSD